MPAASGGARAATWRLGLLFGALAFLQGLGDPTEGLIAQPMRSMLASWGRGASEIAAVSALLAVPWIFKPLYGLLTDFAPIAGSYRRSYLLLAGGAGAVALLGLYAWPVERGGTAALLGWLLVPTIAVAFSDVVVDALLVERAQPVGLTGRLQAIQWACLYAAGIVTGLLGGWLSAGHRQSSAFLICALGALATFGIALVAVREPRRARADSSLSDRLGALRGALRSRTLLGVAAFLVLWNFNPFSNVVLYLHWTRGLHFSEEFYGRTVALTAVASIAASAAYAYYCRLVPWPALARASIVLGVASTMGYALVTDERSAVAVTLAVGFTYMTATLIQLDLAARACPPEAAGTVFALLMALENGGAIVSSWLGGIGYERGTVRWGSGRSFLALLVAGSTLTAACWLIVPRVPEGQR